MISLCLFDTSFISSTQFLISAASTVFPSTFIFYPLTYDLKDIGTESSLRKITNRGIVPNYGLYLENQSTTSSVVSWLSGSNTTTVQFSSKAFNPSSSVQETIFSLATASTDIGQKMLFVYGDDGAASCGRYIFRTYSGSTLTSQDLNRNGWRYEGNNHVSSSILNKWFIQSLFLKDNNTLIYTAHQDNNKSRCFEVNTTTWELQRYFDFSAPYVHVTAIASASNYGWWFADYATGRIINVDLETSFNTNTSSIIQYYTITGSNLLSGLTFIDSASVTLLAYSEYKTALTPRTHIFDPSIISSSGSYNVSASIKYYMNPIRSQGITWKSGSRLLYESSGQNSGEIFEMDIISFLDTGSNDDSHSIFTNMRNIGPSVFPQGIVFDTTDRIWCGTESNLSYEDDLESFSSIWSMYWKRTPIEENCYSITRTTSSIMELKINNRPFRLIAGSNVFDANIFSVGGRLDGTSKFRSGTIKNLYITSESLNSTQISLISNGTASVFDTRSLNVIPFVISNPGAEDGLTDWTNETGSLGTRSLNPRPYNGAKYFTGGTSPEMVTRQRLTIPSSSLWSTKTGSIILDWKQAAFSATAGDRSGMGVVLRNQATTSISSSISPIYTTKWYENAFGSQWEQRLYPSNTVSASTYLDISQRIIRTSGTNNDGYIDDISASIVYWNDDETFGV